MTSKVVHLAALMLRKHVPRVFVFVVVLLFAWLLGLRVVSSPKTALAAAALPIVGLLLVRMSALALMRLVTILACFPFVPGTLRGIPLSAPLFCLIGILVLTKSSSQSGTKLGAWLAASLAVVTLFGMFTGVTSSNYVIGVSLVTSCTWLFVILRQTWSSEDALALIKSLGAGVGIVAAISLAQYFHPSIQMPAMPPPAAFDYSLGATSYSRFSGPLTDYELFGELMMIGGIVSAYLFTRSARTLEGLVWLILCSFCFADAVLSGTRTAILLLVLGVGAVLLLNLRGKGRHPVILTLAGIVLLGTKGQWLTRINTSSGVLARDSQSGGLLSSFATDRLQVWQLYLDRAGATATTWLGNGPRFPNEDFGTYPHNLPLTLLYTAGILGTILWVLFLLTPIVLAVTQRNPHWLLAVVCGGALLVDQLKVEFVRLPFYIATFGVVFSVLWVAAAAKNVNGPSPDRSEADRRNRSEVLQHV
jgi:O-antigen ligase